MKKLKLHLVVENEKSNEGQAEIRGSFRMTAPEAFLNTVKNHHILTPAIPGAVLPHIPDHGRDPKGILVGSLDAFVKALSTSIRERADWINEPWNLSVFLALNALVVPLLGRTGWLLVEEEA